MSLQFGFLPARLCCASGNLLALLTGQLIGSGLAALLAAKLAQLSRRRVLTVGLTLRQFGVTRGHVHNELRELVDVSRTFTFWHGYSMPGPYGIFHLIAGKNDYVMLLS
jgi:hypothetical protein